MLDYIKSQINSKCSVDKAPTPEEMPDEAILECAHIFQELDDITIEGSDAGKVRKLGMDFDLLDEEITPTTVEFLGTLLTTTEPAPILTLSPIFMLKTLRLTHR